MTALWVASAEHTQCILNNGGPAGLRHSAVVMHLLRESPRHREWRSLQARSSCPDMPGLRVRVR